MSTGGRVLVIGLDSVTPELILERFKDELPTLSARVASSAHGVLKSCDPPITVPAWAVMFTGMDPGSLGLYGFRNRKPGTYFEQEAPRPSALPYPAVWDTASRAGKRVCVIGVPPGYPPPAVNGIYVSDLLTPPGAKDFVQPPELAAEIDAIAGGYEFDVTFRSDAREQVGKEILEMTRRRWKVVRALWSKEPWDLFVVHEIGTDRLHHAFWKYFDPSHPRYDPDPRFKDVASEYYSMLEGEIRELLATVDESVTVLLVSDHGSQAMAGCFCLNDWLRQEGYLVLRTAPAEGTPLERADVDWSKTRAWGAGGYYGRLHVNLRGREPEGIVAPGEVSALLEEVTGRLRQVRTPDGRALGVDVALPSELYQEIRGLPPDLLAYFGGLRWRSAGTVGHPGLFLDENDTGPDDAVHSWDGLIAGWGPSIISRGPISASRIRDVAPTILALLGIRAPHTMQGQLISPLLGRHFRAP